MSFSKLMSVCAGRRWVFLITALLVAVPLLAQEEGPEAGHANPAAGVVLSLAVILIAAKFGGHLAAKVGQPPVLGELLAGVIIGNLPLIGFHSLAYLGSGASAAMLARIGVILLLFSVGLESTVKQMMQVGLSSLLVATVGVIGPFVLGWGVGAWLLPEHSVYMHLFLGATLTATSVGITAP